MAKSIPAIVEPVVLRWARETIGVSEVAASRKLDLSNDRVAAWETEDRRPETHKSRNCGEPPSFTADPSGCFFLAEPPEGFDTLRYLRRHESPTAR